MAAGIGGRFVPLGELQEDEEKDQNTSNQEMVISLLNEAMLLSKDEKMERLAKVRELIINKEPALLDNFFEEVMAFQQDTSVDVRKFVISFIEDACKKDSHILPRAIPMLQFILTDEHGAVRKRVIVCFLQLYRSSILYMLKQSTEDDSLRELWQAICGIKQDIFNQLDSDNDGIRALVIKFIELIVLTQTSSGHKGQDGNGEQDISIDMVPGNHPLLKVPELKQEANAMLRKVLDLATSQCVSSIGLMTCIGMLSTVARQRPVHLSTVIQTFEILHGSFPPKFSSSQINSVAKHLKSQVLALLRHPSSYEYRDQLVTLLTVLGCTQSEINKNMPKRPRVNNEGGSHSKKQKMGVASGVGVASGEEIKGNAFLEAVDITTNELKDLLVIESVVDIVLASMGALPPSIPVGFRHSYTPIAAAGTHSQIVQTARLLASHMTAAGIGRGAVNKGIQGHTQREASPTRTERIIKQEPVEEMMDVDLQHNMDQLHYLGSLLGLPSVSDPLFPLAYTKFFGSLPPDSNRGREESVDRGNLVSIQTVSDGVQSVPVQSSVAPPQKLKKITQFDLSSIVKATSTSELQRVGVAAFQRILDNEDAGGLSQARSNLIIKLAIQFGGDYNTALYSFIINNFKSHIDLAISWLYALYCLTPPTGTPTYDECLTMLMKGAHSVLDSRDRLFTRLLLEAPLVTHNALMIVKSYCNDEERAFLGLSTLRDLVLKKPQRVGEFMDVILSVTTAESELARVQSLHIVKKFYTRPELALTIEKFAVQMLQSLLSDHPSFQQVHSDLEVTTEWNEVNVKVCIGPFLTLLPLNCQLLKELAIVYTNTTASVKRILLKLLDQPVRGIGMHSPQLLELVEVCPKGAETLILRILYILTENATPSVELVQRVRELYQKNSTDVRFLIPVLQGLTKQEIVTALPMFIRLSPNVTKGVFDRLLMSYRAECNQLPGPLSPSELLVALHTIDCKGDDALTKAVVRATNLCFQEKGVYTQEVLAVSLQQLVELTPVPLLFMRTVIQSLGVCPRLINFVMTILTKLIGRQVWKQAKVWQGFIKCCEVTTPHSFQVIVQLPAKQLESLLKASSQIRDPFFSYMRSLTTNQRSGIPRSVWTVFEKESQRQDEELVQQKPKKRKISSQGDSEQLTQ